MSVDMILSTNVLKNGCMDFSDYPPSEDVYLEFSYWLDNFSLFNRINFFLFLNFDLNIENELLLLLFNWNFLFTVIIYNIFNVN